MANNGHEKQLLEWFAQQYEEKGGTFAKEAVEKRMRLALEIMNSAILKVQELGLVPRYRHGPRYARVIHIGNVEIGFIGPGSRPGHKPLKVSNPDYTGAIIKDITK